MSDDRITAQEYEIRGWHAEDVRALRMRLKLTQPQLADLFGMTADGIKRWESGKHPIPSPACIVLQTLSDLGKEDFRKFASGLSSVTIAAKNGSNDDASDAPAEFDADAVLALCKRLDVTSAGLARLMGVTDTAVRTWLKGKVKPKGPAEIVMRQLWERGLAILPKH